MLLLGSAADCCAAGCCGAVVVLLVVGARATGDTEVVDCVERKMPLVESKQRERGPQSHNAAIKQMLCG